MEAHINFRAKFIDDALRFIIPRKSDLTEWELKFLNDVSAIRCRNIELSKSQYNTLQNIYNKLKN